MIIARFGDVRIRIRRTDCWVDSDLVKLLCHNEVAWLALIQGYLFFLIMLS